ncbi:unnamed protein product [Gadus morhua 'NCC']
MTRLHVRLDQAQRPDQRPGTRPETRPETRDQTRDQGPENRPETRPETRYQTRDQGPGPEKDFLTHEGYSVPGAVGSQVARGDVARFLLSQLDADAWVKKGVAMHTK